MKAGRHDESVTAATHAVRLMPRHANAYYTRACAYALRGEPGPAVADIGRALEADPDLRAQIREDEDFTSLSEDPRFRALVAPTPAAHP